MQLYYFNGEYKNAENKCQILKNIKIQNEIITFEKLVKNCLEINWVTPEWGFPKGKKGKTMKMI